MLCWVQECIDEFGNSTGGCERLLSTPLPLSYTRHTSRSLFLWLLTMPLSLYQPMGYAMIPALFLMTFILIGNDDQPHSTNNNLPSNLLQKSSVQQCCNVVYSCRSLADDVWSSCCNPYAIRDR